MRLEWRVVAMSMGRNLNFFVEVEFPIHLSYDESKGLECSWFYSPANPRPEDPWIKPEHGLEKKFKFEVADSGIDVERPRDLQIIFRTTSYLMILGRISLGSVNLRITINDIPLHGERTLMATLHRDPYSEKKPQEIGVKIRVKIWRSRGNRSSQDTQAVAGSSAANNWHDLDEPIETTNVVEFTKRETENIRPTLNKRVVAKAAHLEEVTALVNTNLSRVVEAFGDSWLREDTSPLSGISQIVAQSQQRAQLMLASKQTLEKLLLRHSVISRIDDALDNERRLVNCVTKPARDAGEQQKELYDLEQNVYLENLVLIEKYNKEQMQLLETFQQEKQRRLHLWAASRKDSLDRAKSIESKSQFLITHLNSLVETTRQYEKELEAEVSRKLGIEKGEETSKSSKQSCQICFHNIGGLEPSETREHLKQRSCLVPCNHAMICLPCATKIWESTKLCPFCNVNLTTKPCPLYL